MKRINLAVLLISVAAAALFGGCGSDEPFSHVVFADSPEMFTSVTELNNGRASRMVAEGVSYYIVFDDESRKATLTINNLNTPAAGSGEILTFTNIDWTYEPGSHETRRVIQAAELRSDISVGGNAVLTDVNIIYIESNELNSGAGAGFYAAYIVDNIYSVMSYPYSVRADGTTTLMPEDGGGLPDVDYAPVYYIWFNPDRMTADMAVQGVRMAGMALDLKLRGLVLELTDYGYELKYVPDRSVAICDDKVVAVQAVEAVADLRDVLKIRLSLSVEGDGVWVLEAFLSPVMSMERD